MVVLPNEILCMIIGFLNKEDLLLVRLVNKKCQYYAEDYLRAIYFSVKNDEDVSQFLKLTSWRNFEKTIPPYVRFYFNICYYNYKETSNEILEEFINRYGNVIQGLRYNGKHIGDNSMYKLLMNTPNIQEIHRPLNTSSTIWSNSFIHKNEYELYFPKLRTFNFNLADQSAIILKQLLNASPNVQKIDLYIRPQGNFQDFLIILYLISSKNIKVKMNMSITTSEEDSNYFELQSFQEIIKVNLIITDLRLTVLRTSYGNMSNVAKVQESIEEFMEKLSENLKHLKIYYGTGEKKVLSLHFKHMKKLETVELRHSCNISGTLLEVKFGFVPLLKKVNLEAAVLNFVLSVPSLKHLHIESDTISDCLHSLQLLDEKVRLETLSLMYIRKANKTVFTQKCIEHLNDFLISQATNIKILSIAAGYFYNENVIMDEIELPKMEKLQKLKLGMKEPKVKKLQQSQFPNLQILRLYTPSQAIFNESMKNIHTLIIEMTSIPDFIKTTPQFPNLKKLHITNVCCPNKSIMEFFRIIFKNMTHVKELEFDWGGSWDAFTGNSEVVDFLAETSIKTIWTLNTSFSNLGDLIALESLKLKCNYKADQEHIKAVAYLILCGKLRNLKYFEARTVQSEHISLLAKIFTSNNIKINFNYHKSTRNGTSNVYNCNCYNTSFSQGFSTIKLNQFV